MPVLVQFELSLSQELVKIYPVLVQFQLGFSPELVQFRQDSIQFCSVLVQFNSRFSLPLVQFQSSFGADLMQFQTNFSPSLTGKMTPKETKYTPHYYYFFVCVLVFMTYQYFSKINHLSNKDACENWVLNFLSLQCCS